jgi:predicted dehydrogenase
MTDKFKIGIVGLNFGEYIVSEISGGNAAPYFTLEGICDINTERAAYISKKHNVKAYSSLKDMLGSGDISVVGLFTGPVGRAKIIKQIIESGRDVITTKPFETDAAEAEDVLKLARRLGRKIMLNSPSPTPLRDLRKIISWADEYELGRIIACRCDSWVSYREKADGTWYDNAGLCPVAPIFRLGIYLINDLVRLIGKARDVQVLHSRIFTGRPTPDNAQLGILFENGAIANVFSSFCVGDGQYYKNSLILNYERGTITRNIGLTTREMTSEKAFLTLTALCADGRQTVQNYIADGSPEEYPWLDFYNILQNKNEIPEKTDMVIVEAIRVVNAMARAEKSGRTEKV